MYVCVANTYVNEYTHIDKEKKFRKSEPMFSRYHKKWRNEKVSDEPLKLARKILNICWKCHTQLIIIYSMIVVTENSVEIGVFHRRQIINQHRNPLVRSHMCKPCIIIQIQIQPRWFAWSVAALLLIYSIIWDRNLHKIDFSCDIISHSSYLLCHWFCWLYCRSIHSFYISLAAFSSIFFNYVCMGVCAFFLM